MVIGYKLDSIKFELRCMTDWCDVWLQGGKYNFELRCDSDCFDYWLQIGKYNV